MTTVTSAEHVVRQFRWEAPSPGVYGDIADALAFAQAKAQEFGIDVTKDDWLHYRCYDEVVRFWFDVEAPA